MAVIFTDQWVRSDVASWNVSSLACVTNYFKMPMSRKPEMLGLTHAHTFAAVLCHAGCQQLPC